MIKRQEMGPESAETAEFKEYLATEFKITDTRKQYLITQIFRYSAIKSARDLGLLPYWDPMEAAKHHLIVDGVTDPESQRVALNRLYQDIEDPRPS